jgi:hypothetical protein
MEAEEAAAKRLEELGYTIFYRNLLFRYGFTDICEFDIVLKNCIVEVKSGKYVYPIENGGFNNIVMGGYLPKGFTYYVYCTAKSDEEIIEINADLGRTDIIYINRLEDITLKHCPDGGRCIIESMSKMMLLMNRSFESVLKFNKLYMTQDTYDKVYMQYNFGRDEYSLNENMMWSGKLRYLVESGRIVICDKFPETAVSVEKMLIQNRKTKAGMRPDRSMKAIKGKEIRIPIFHNLSDMPKIKDITHLYIDAYDMRAGKRT